MARRRPDVRRPDPHPSGARPPVLPKELVPGLYDNGLPGLSTRGELYRPYVVAVLTLDGEIAPVMAQQMGIEFTDLAELAQHPQVRAMAQAAVDAANERLSRPEQVKSFELLPVEWTAESEELTPRRGVQLL